MPGVRAFFIAMTFVYEADGTGTDQELLDLNREAQARIMKHGQEYQDEHGHRVRLAELATLKKQEKDLLAAIDAAANGMCHNLVEFRRRP